MSYDIEKLNEVRLRSDMRAMKMFGWKCLVSEQRLLSCVGKIPFQIAPQVPLTRIASPRMGRGRRATSSLSQASVCAIALDKAAQAIGPRSSLRCVSLLQLDTPSRASTHAQDAFMAETPQTRPTSADSVRPSSAHQVHTMYSPCVQRCP